jgi:hypothetical protein
MAHQQSHDNKSLDLPIFFSGALFYPPQYLFPLRQFVLIYDAYVAPVTRINVDSRLGSGQRLMRILQRLVWSH